MDILSSAKHVKKPHFMKSSFLFPEFLLKDEKIRVINTNFKIFCSFCGFLEILNELLKNKPLYNIIMHHEVYMHEFSFEQENWLRLLFIRIFPYVSSDYPIDIFEPYLRFAEKHELFLSEHLQYRENNTPLFEVDVPTMINKPPFRSLINSTYLENFIKNIELKMICVKQDEVDIFENISDVSLRDKIRNEDNQFKKGFQDNFKTENKYEDVPDLFIKKIMNEGACCKYSPERNNFLWDSSFSINKANTHTPNDIIKAYQYFAHKVYNLRAFGIWRGLSETNHEILFNIHLFDYFKEDDNNPFYIKLLGKAENDPYGIYNDRSNAEILGLYFQYTHYKFEAKIDYTPTNPELWLQVIKKESYYNLIFNYENRLNSSSVLPVLSESEKIKIRTVFNGIIQHKSLNLISKKTYEILQIENAPSGKGNVFDKAWAINELRNDRKSQEFLLIPEIANLFTHDFLKILINLFTPINEVEIDTKVGDEKYSENILINKIIDNNKIECIYSYIENQFPNETNTKFIDKLKINMEYLLNNICKNRNEIQEYELSQYFFNIWFDIYTDSENSEKNTKIEPIRRLFNKKIKNIFNACMVIISIEDISDYIKKQFPDEGEKEFVTYFIKYIKQYDHKINITQSQLDDLFCSYTGIKNAYKISKFNRKKKLFDKKILNILHIYKVILMEY